MQYFRAKQCFDFFRRGGSVLDDVMQNTGGHAFRIQFHICEDTGHLEGMGQVGFSGKSHLAFVDPGRINIGALNNVQVGIWNVIADLIDDIVNPDQCGLFVIFYRLFVIDNRISANGYQLTCNRLESWEA